ncbi:MAG TPA: hypothetical protein DD640_07220 [Clostridiales bacterium]|nr:hypothetical protein [Clostridiales bacterium]
MTQALKMTIDMPAYEAARRLLLAYLDEIRIQAPLALDADPARSAEAVHDLRVALRRSLTVLDSYAPWLNAESTRAARKGYRKLLKPLGELRDLDVLAEQAGECRTESAVSSSDLISLLGQERDKKRSRLPELLDGRDFQDWLSQRGRDLSAAQAALNMALPAITGRGKVQMHRLQECLPVMLYSAAANLTVYHSILRSPAGFPETIRLSQAEEREVSEVSDVVLHRLRIFSKQFRYLLEMHQTTLGPSARQMIQEFKRYQDLLGNWHDAVQAVAYLSRRQNLIGKDSCAFWQEHWQQSRSALQSEFLSLWPELTAAWFHQRISASLDYAANSSDGTCACARSGL